MPKNGTGYTDFGFKKQLTRAQKDEPGVDSGMTKRMQLDDGVRPGAESSTKKTSKNRE